MTKPMTEDELNTIERRALRASPGPWLPGQVTTNDGLKGEVTIGKRRWRSLENVEQFNPDSTFIACSRDDVQRLVAEIRRQRALLDQVDAASKRIEAGIDRITAQPDRRSFTGRLPCPFCGSIELSMVTVGEQRTPLLLQCNHCGSTGPQADTETRLGALWDVRAKAI